MSQSFVSAAAARAADAQSFEKRPAARAPPRSPDSSDSDEEQDERQAEIWRRVQKVLREYCLSPLALAACKKWVREMADPSNEKLARLRSWLLNRINGRERAPPPRRPAARPAARRLGERRRLQRRLRLELRRRRGVLGVGSALQ